MARANKDASKPLTPQEKLFVAEYISNGFVAVDAYLVAFPTTSRNSANSNAYYQLKKAHVRAEVMRVMKEHFGDLDELATKALMKLEQIAFAPRGDEYYASAAQLKALELIQKQLGLQTQNIKAHVEKNSVIEINILGGEEDEPEA